jgi:hypothetical protein
VPHAYPGRIGAIAGGESPYKNYTIHLGSLYSAHSGLHFAVRTRYSNQDLRTGGQKPGFLRKYLITACRNGQKPGFFGIYAKSYIEKLWLNPVDL